MSEKRKVKTEISIWQWMYACLMVLCLTFLTSINYFLYPWDGETTVNVFGTNTDESENDFPPSGPTEEKSTTSTGFSTTEEMLHEMHPEVNFEVTNFLYLHHIAEAEKLEIFHPEIILRPPKFQA